MPRYRLHRIKSAPGESFRWAAHTGGLAVVKTKDYEIAEELEGENPYSIWKLLLQEGRSLRPGDLLELVLSEDQPAGSGEIQIAKYIGFEPAKWYVPEPKPSEASAPGAAPDRPAADIPA